MYELAVQTEFCAAHAIVMAGVREPVHGHTWRVTVVVGGETLDGDGLLCDFHALQRALGDATQPFDSRDLNQVPPFDVVNPTAENVARHIAARLQPALPTGLEIKSVSVTEAPGCVATFRPTSR